MTVGPAWTQGKIEKPAGTKDMGAWVKAVYTPEQRERLQIDEDGKHNKVLPDGEYSMQQGKNMRFLDAHETAAPAPAVTRPAQGDDSQVWVVKADQDGLYTIQQKKLKRFLDAESDKAYNAFTSAAPTGTNKWVIKSIGDGAYSIQHDANMRFLDAFEDEKSDFRVCTRTAQKDGSQKWVIKGTAKTVSHFVLVPEHYLPAGNEITSGDMTLEEAEKAASVEDAIGFTWKGDRHPKGKVEVYVKNSKCSKDAVPGAGWYTMLKHVPEKPADKKPDEEKPPMFVLVPEHFLPAGNEITSGEMTLEEAEKAASVEDAIGFTWQGDRHPKGKVTVYVKNSKCSKEASPGAGWYTMLKCHPEEPSAKKPRTG